MARGTLMSKTEDESYHLIEEMELNNYQWSNEWGQPKWAGDKFDVGNLTLFTTKMDMPWLKDWIVWVWMQ